MSDWTTARVTPEMLAELRRLLDSGPLRPWTAGTVDGVDYGAVWGAVTKRNGIYVTPMIVDDVSLWPGTAELIAAAVNALPALLDAATERDRLAGLLDEPRRSGCTVEIAGVRIAPCDERGQTADMRALDTAADRDRLAAAWDEGHQAGHEDARAVQSTYPEPTPNPYQPEGETHE